MPDSSPNAAEVVAAIRRRLDDHQWTPIRQHAVAHDPQHGWWWKLALALLPSLFGALLLWHQSQPVAEWSPAPTTTRIEVVFLPRARPASTPPVPAMPEAPPALRPLRSLIAAPVSEPPAVDALTEPGDALPAAPAALPPPSAGDLLRQLEYNASRSEDGDDQRISRRGRPRLPGRAEAFVDGIHVRGRPSPDQRLQFVLGLIGLGRPDPCPDIRRHVRDAIAAEQRGQGIDGELDHWLNRAEHCRR